MEHERGVPPIIHSGWIRNDFNKAEAEVNAQQKHREERLAREGDIQVVKPLQRGNKQHSAAVQKIMEDMERELVAIAREARTAIIIVLLYTMHCVT